MKRILVFSLALILAFGFLVVPSYAAESIEPTVVNLLNAADFYYVDQDGTSYLRNSPFNWCSGVTNVSMKWSYDSSFRFNKIVVFLKLDKQPTAVYLKQSHSFEGTLVGVTNGVYCYEFVSSDNSASYSINIQYNNRYYGDFNVLSCYGIYENTAIINDLTWFSNAVYRYKFYDEENNEKYHEGYSPLPVGSASNSSLPVIAQFTGPGYGANYDLIHGEFFGKFSSPVEYMKSGSIVLFTSGKISDYGVRLENSDGSIICGLDSSLEYFGETQMVFELDENFERLHMYVLSFDLDGISLADALISFDLNVTSVWGGASWEYGSGFYCQVDSISLHVPVEESPWFTPLVRFFRDRYNALSGWLSSGFSSVTSTLSTWGQNLQSSLTTGFSSVTSTLSTWGQNLKDTLTTGFSSVTSTLSTWGQNLKDTLTTGFSSVVSSVVTWGENLRSAVVSGLESVDARILAFRQDFDWWMTEQNKQITKFKESVEWWFDFVVDTLKSSGDNKGFNDDVNNQGQQLDDMQQVMDSVQKPDLGSINTDLSGIVSPADTANIAQVYTMVIGDGFVGQIMTMVVIMAMMSFVLFGKR